MNIQQGMLVELTINSNNFYSKIMGYQRILLNLNNNHNLTHLTLTQL